MDNQPDEHEDWFSPKRLTRQNRESRIKSVNELNLGGDFGIYALANRGLGMDLAAIRQHNLVNTKIRAVLYREILGNSKYITIADLGCGLGFTTAALAEEFMTNQVTGYEISEDACEFAAKAFPSINFLSEAVYPHARLQEKYDLILAQEFYPFTRTSEYECHLGYVKTLANSLSEKGVILITFRDGTKNSIFSSIPIITEELAKIGYVVTLFPLPFDRIRQYIPSYILSNWLSKLLASLLGKKRLLVVKISCAPTKTASA